MRSRHIWAWAAIAVLLFAAILAQRNLGPSRQGGVQRILPRLQASAVTRITIQPLGQKQIRAERTNGSWVLVEPLNYPAQAVTIEALLAKLEQLTPATLITAGELKDRPNADEDYGFTNPQASIVVEQPNYRAHILVGAKTAPGDQVFLQVVGSEGVNVVDTDILKLLPQTANALRDTAFVNITAASIDRISVNSGQRGFEIERDPQTRVWRMPRPIPMRADNERITKLLRDLNGLRVVQFVSDDTNADLEGLKLQPPELELGLKQGANTVASLCFGRSPTNDASLVFARRAGQPAVVTVSKDLVAPWRGAVNDFRDSHLFTLGEPVGEIEVRGPAPFSLQRQTNQTWRVLPDGFVADPALVQALQNILAGMRIVEFTKDIVTPADLATYGLANPSRVYSLRSLPVSGVTGTTNRLLVQIEFGTNVDNRIYVRRTDESSVYAITYQDFLKLPVSGIQLRDRSIWSVSLDSLAGATIRQHGKVRQLLRNGPHQWSFALGSGVINDLAVEETVKMLCSLSAGVWVDRGTNNLSLYGLGGDAHTVTLDLKSGDKKTVQFGGPSATDSNFAAVTIDGEPWVFVLPPNTYRFIETYLTIPGNSL